MLLAECEAAGVRVFTGCAVERVGDDLAVFGSAGVFRPQSLVIATGGLTVPKIGATPFGYRVARQFGISVVECRPALVPLTFSEKDKRNYSDLTGVSMEVVATTDGHAFHEKMLITHRGVSGPAILQASSYWQPRSRISVDLAPGQQVTAALYQGKTKNDSALKNAFVGILPKRFAERWIELHPPKDWTNLTIENFERAIHHWEFVPSGTEGYEKAEVTAGGVDTDELSSKTMESHKVPGLFFIGEVVDVTGHLGGFNFQWAWASGFATGQAV